MVEELSIFMDWFAPSFCDRSGALWIGTAHTVHKNGKCHSRNGKVTLFFLPRDLEEDLVPLCRQLGIGIVAYVSVVYGVQMVAQWSTFTVGCVSSISNDAITGTCTKVVLSYTFEYAAHQNFSAYFDTSPPAVTFVSEIAFGVCIRTVGPFLSLPIWAAPLPIWTAPLPIWTAPLPIWTAPLPIWTAPLPLWCCRELQTTKDLNEGDLRSSRWGRGIHKKKKKKKSWDDWWGEKKGWGLGLGFRFRV